MTAPAILAATDDEQLTPLRCDAVRNELPALQRAFDPDAMQGTLDVALSGGREPRIVRCDAPSATYLPGNGCTLRYAVQLAGRSGDPELTVVTARLFTSGRAADWYLNQRLASLGSRLAGRTHDPPLPSTVALVDEMRMTTAVFPVDGELPTLVDATDPQIVTGLLRGDGIATEHPVRVQLGHYGRGRRCVLRYLAAGSGQETRVIIGKVVADGGGAQAHAVFTALRAGSDRRPSSAETLHVPAPLGYHAQQQLLLLESVPGAALCSARVKRHLRGEEPQSRAAQEIATCARIAATLHRQRVHGVPGRTADSDLRHLEAAVAQIRSLAPELGNRIVDRLGAVRDQLSRSAPLAPDFCHGDFKLNQIIGEGAQRSLIDLDTACQAEPALDLGQFLAYLRLKALDLGGTDRVDDLARTFLDAYVEGREWRGQQAARLERRTAAYEALSLLSRAVHSWHKFKPERLRAALTLLDGGP